MTTSKIVAGLHKIDAEKPQATRERPPTRESVLTRNALSLSFGSNGRYRVSRNEGARGRAAIRQVFEVR